MHARAIPSIGRQHLFHNVPPELEGDPRWSTHLEASRGRGYWFWKPALLNLLWGNGTFKDGDTVIWVDADAIASVYLDEGVAEFQSVLATTDWDILVRDQQYCEAEWTKGDIFKHFGVPWHDRHYGMTPQVHADFWVARLNGRTRKLMRMWEDLVQDFHLLSDEPSVAPNGPHFIENRHDQSLLSMLVKANMPQISTDVRDCTRFLREIPESDAPGRPWLRHKTYGIPGLVAKVGDLWHKRLN